MKKITAALTILSFLFAASVSTAGEFTTSGASAISIADWTKSNDGIWKNKDGTMNKLDAQQKLQWSQDGQSWIPNGDGVWTDNNGVFIKVGTNNLVSSTDGFTWTPLADNKFEGQDNHTYKFDGNWDLWVL